VREVIETKIVYTWDSATPKIREKIREDFHINSDLGHFMLSERIDTLKALAGILKGNLDYYLSAIPDRGEYITIKPKYDELDFCALHDLIDSGNDCPFTGVCYDQEFIDEFIDNKDGTEEDNLKYALDKYICAIHKEYEFMLSDEYLKDHAEANEYEFNEDGSIYHE